MTSGKSPTHLAILLMISIATGCASVPSEHIDPKAQQCLALAMYWEARGEGRRGMVAVGSVVLNRVADNRFPNTLCAFVHQGGEIPPCQFSWWCDCKSDKHADSD